MFFTVTVVKFEVDNITRFLQIFIKISFIHACELRTNRHCFEIEPLIQISPLILQEAFEVQSEHWNKKKITIFIAVLGWLSKSSWDAADGELLAGAEVTVHGELSDREINESSFWAKIIKKTSNGK